MTGNLHPENCILLSFSVLLRRAEYLEEWLKLKYLGDTEERPWKITKSLWNVQKKKTMRRFIDFPRLPIMCRTGKTRVAAAYGLGSGRK